MHEEIDDFFNLFTPDVATMARALFEITAKVMLPDKKIWIDRADKMITFGTDRTIDGEICYIKPLKDSVNLGFFHGASLHDPNKLLQGTGKRLRHIKFKNIEDVDHKAIRVLLEAALTAHNARLMR